jgi:hypothetical protein
MDDKPIAIGLAEETLHRLRQKNGVLRFLSQLNRGAAIDTSDRGRPGELAAL